MLLYRVLSAVVGIPVVLCLVWYGSIPLTLAVLIISLLGIHETGALFKKIGNNVWMPGAFLGGFLFVINAHLVNIDLLGIFLLTVIAAGLIYLVMSYPRFNMIDLAVTVFISLYAGWLLTHIINLRQLPGGFHLVFLMMGATWSTDTFAYFIGSAWGKTKLAPLLSPNKSVEGSIGGILGSVAVSVVFWAVGQHFAIIHYIIIGILVGLMGQVGDLAESALKRFAGVKDSGKIIPGHGGIMDRFDSMLITAPVIYYYLKLVIFV
ncbi:phosphatidate cytidylyltransferase [Phosphitispora sp. TUW77]|uniref:phosphatidate cytidylyltransferase n=1 Tax=Phosphitispora sp. TUW77 TaxID=3152361 RepID=UPI003AB15887